MSGRIELTHLHHGFNIFGMFLFNTFHLARRITILSSLPSARDNKLFCRSLVCGGLKLHDYKKRSVGRSLLQLGQVLRVGMITKESRVDEDCVDRIGTYSNVG
ncbi:hypothetical protein Salat_2919200 [Sesamum alatum]|uniref:Uncharacterized protein n=1 Tax=Sesamum alatum TaxID=300844 RepID=A0AAE1XIT5_9LAMI|nr:hypothetical protein Salat_2919200 [Sesamum alatum]